MLINLRRLRKETGISQQKLADAIDMSQQSINQYENHNVEPDIMTLSKMADYFETSIDYIVGRTDIRDHIEKTMAYNLNEEEARMMNNYRTLTPKERACVAQVIDTLLEK